MAYKKLSIPNPCSQKWGKMKPMGEGRHCTSCDRIIVDFSNISDEELIKVLKTGKYHCGRFSGEQLEKIYYIGEPQRQRKKYWGAIAAAIVAGMFTVSTTYSQTPQQTRRAPQTLIKKGDPEKYTEKEEVKNSITIVVLDGNSKTGLQSVQVNLIDLGISSSTNKEGSSILDVNHQYDEKQMVTVELSIWGYKSKTIKIRLDKLLNKTKTFYLNRKKFKRSGYKHMGVPIFNYEDQ